MDLLKEAQRLQNQADLSVNANPHQAYDLYVKASNEYLLYCKQIPQSYRTYYQSLCDYCLTKAEKLKSEGYRSLQTYTTRPIDCSPIRTPNPTPLRSFIKIEEPKPLRYSDIYGLEEIKAEFDKICYSITNHTLTENDGKYLISGPYHSGKHLLVKVLCAKLQAKCYSLELDSVSQLHSDDISKILKYMFEDSKNELQNRIGIIMINFDFNYPVPLSLSVYNTITNYIESFKSINNNTTMLFFGISSNYDNFNSELIKIVNKSFITRYPDIFTLQKDYLLMIHNNLNIQERQQLVNLVSGKSIPEIRSIFDHYAAVALGKIITFNDLSCYINQIH